jgi:biopolymer transport protein ExbD
MSRRLWWLGGIGLVLILIGIALPAGFHEWMQTRNWVALEIPISMAPGHIRTPEFEINVEGDYWIYVDVDREFMPDVVGCLLGLGWPGCGNHSSVIQTSWSVTDGGKEIARNRPTPAIGVGPYDRVGRAIGSFAPDKSKHYVLDLDILQDASALNGGNPRLRIEELGGAYVRYLSVEDDLSSLGFLIGIAGIVVVVVALVGRAREKERSRIPLTNFGPQPRELFFDPTDASRVSVPQGLEKKKLPVSFWFGAVLFCAGVASFSWMAIWLQSRNWVPIDMPISLARGHVRTGPFKINVKAGYDVAVDYKMPFEGSWNCFRYDRSKAGWSLYRNGVPVKDVHDQSPYAYLGGFDAEEGTYDLDLQIDLDTSCLDAGHPRLRISTERYLFANRLDPWLWLSAICVPCGTSLMVLGLVARFRKEDDPACGLIGEPTVGLRFYWAQTLPLKKPFSGLPPFGLTAGLVFALVFLTWQLIDAVAYDSHHSRGFYVRAAQNLMNENKSTTQPEPLQVRIEAVAPGKEPRVYLNGTPLPWIELERSLQRRIGRPSDCRVLISADDDVAWYNALRVMDVARGLGCNVVLLTGDSGKVVSH